MSQEKIKQKESPETILTRHPLPKYNFTARKLPKESPSPPTKTSSSTESARTNIYPEMPPTSLSSATSQTALPASSHLSHSMQRTSLETALPPTADRKSAAVKPFSTSVKPDSSLPTMDRGTVKPVAAVVTPNLRSGATAVKSQENRVKFDIGETSRESGDAVAGLPTVKAPPAAVPVASRKAEVPLTFLPTQGVIYSESNDIPVPDAALLLHAVEGPSTEEKLEKAEKEVKMLRSQLDVQLQVNAEIKRLLVASVGEDFERKVENLARDRAQLAMDLGDFTKKMTADYENLDQISIQADMWRSKYLASRVMVEELAAARAFYSSQFQDSQQVMQELLNERYELRANLLQSYKCLQQVKEAFDPFNAQKSHSLPSTNVLDLASNIKQLSDAVRYRLLPAHAGSHIMLPLEESWESTMTRAELLAYDQLSKQTTPPSFKHSLPTPVMASSTSYQRFHPMARHDNVTVNCCSHCKGDILVA